MAVNQKPDIIAIATRERERERDVAKLNKRMHP
jgi:hypothetical protein